MSDVKIEKIVISIGKKKFELTPEEAVQVKDELCKLLKDPVYLSSVWTTNSTNAGLYGDLQGIYPAIVPSEVK